MVVLTAVWKEPKWAVLKASWRVASRVAWKAFRSVGNWDDSRAASLV